MKSAADRARAAEVQAGGIVIEPTGGGSERSWFAVQTEAGKLVGTGYVHTPRDGAPQVVHFVTVRVLWSGAVARTEYTLPNTLPGDRWGTIAAFFATLGAEGLLPERVSPPILRARAA